MKKTTILSMLLCATLSVTVAQTRSQQAANKPASKKEQAEKAKADKAAAEAAKKANPPLSKKEQKEKEKAEKAAAANAKKVAEATGQSSQSVQKEKGGKASRRGRVNKWMYTADQAYAKEHFHKAFGYYERAFGRAPEGEVRMRLRWKMGETQRRLNHSIDAISFFNRVWESGNRDKEFLTSYADVLLKTANYGKADTVYRMLHKLDTTDAFIKMRLESCKLGKEYRDSLAVITTQEIQNQYRINSPFSEYGLSVVDGKLIFSSAKRTNPRTTDNRTSQGFSHLYTASIFPDSLLWQNPMPLSFNIWGDRINDGVFSYDPENKIGYFHRCNTGNCGIYTTKNDNGNWTIPELFPINGVGADNTVGHPSISPDGKRLLFVTRAPGSEGGSDIWITSRIEKVASTRSTRSSRVPTAKQNTKVATSKKTSKAASKQTEKAKAAPPAKRPSGKKAAPVINNPEWTVPVNLGKMVNSKGDEVFPSWINNNAFAFSSNGKVGYGGLDIYIAILDSLYQPSEIKHVEAPINSSFDDYSVVLSPDIEKGYFSSARFNGNGKTDEIYSFPKKASLIEFSFDIKDQNTQAPLANTQISICAGDSCLKVTTDSLGKAYYASRKSAPVYSLSYERPKYYPETQVVKVNEALDVIPVRDMQIISIAMQKDTTPIDTVPVEWEYLAKNTSLDTVELIAMATIDSAAKLYAPENACLKVFKYAIDSSPYYTILDDLQILGDSVYTFDSLSNCLENYYENEVFFSQKIITNLDSLIDVKGKLSYAVKTPDSTFVFHDKVFSIPVKATLSRDTSTAVDSLPEKPILSWYYTLIQRPNSDSMFLEAKTFIPENSRLFGLYQNDSTQKIAIRFRYTPDPEKYSLVDSVYSLTAAEKAPFQTLHTDVTFHKDSVSFVQQILSLYDYEYRILGAIDYTLALDTHCFEYVNVPLSFTINSGKEDQSALLAAAPAIDTTPTPIIDTTPAEEPIDDSWLDGVEMIPNPIFDNKMKVNEAGVQDLSECMKPGMTAQEIIECLNKNRKDEETVDLRNVDIYKDRINDPNRRKNLTVLPSSTKCKDCEKNPQRQDVKQDLFISSGDDKKILKLTDQGGNITYIDLAPNTKYQINVETAVIDKDGGASLPSYINASDVVKTVSTKDYIIYECMPKLAEIGDETYVNNLYFDFDKKDIIKDGHRELDRMIIIALKNPNMKFEVTTHADERGTNEYNQFLTEQRLQSVTNYIAKKGLDSDRLITRAAGESDPLIKNATTDEEHALNRRTTIRLFNPTASNELKKMDYEIPESNPLDKSGMWFRVQIGAFKTPPEYPLFFFRESLSAVPECKLSYFQDRDGIFKYSVGEFSRLEDARRLNARLLDSGKEAYVVAYYNGQRITIAEAQVILNKSKKK